MAATLAAPEIGLPLVRGGLTLFPLFSDLPPAPGYLTGPEAANAQLLVADELASGAVVPELEIHNQAEDAILLIDGETLLGAYQNRCLDVSVLCPARSVTAVAVSCVEAGRWGSHRPMTRSTRLTPAALRSRNRSAVGHAVRSGDEPRGNQGRVWEDVSAYMQRLQVEAPTAAMEDVHRSAETTVSKLIDGTAPLKGQRGVAAYVGGDLLAIDLFDTATTMAAYWEGLVGGYALDAIGRSFVDVRRRQVRSVFASIAAAPPVQAPSKGLGDRSTCSPRRRPAPPSASRASSSTLPPARLPPTPNDRDQLRSVPDRSSFAHASGQRTTSRADLPQGSGPIYPAAAGAESIRSSSTSRRSRARPQPLSSRRRSPVDPSSQEFPGVQ